MAMLAPKSAYPSSMGVASNQAAGSSQYSGNLSSHRTPVIGSSHSGPFASPTESEFSEGCEPSDTAVRSWDERRVGEWLRSINCSQYEHLFRSNNVTGSNLIECDQLVLKEMGIKKIGDRVRMFVAIKQLRTKAIGNTKKRMRDSITSLEANNRPGYTPYTPSSGGSPRHRERPHPTPPADKRYSRVLDPSALANFQAELANHRPSSPLAESARRYEPLSPTESKRNFQAQASDHAASQPPSAKTTTGRGPGTPNRQYPVVDSTVGKLPMSPVIRVIYNGGQTKVLDIKNCRTAEEIMLNVLRKLSLPERQTKNHCFYLLNGIDPNLAHCHRLSDDELVRVCTDLYRSDRGRLILRKIHAGEPDEDELRKAASISTEEHMDTQQAQAIATNLDQSKGKVQQLTGEDWDAHPLASASYKSPRERTRNNSSAGSQWNAPERSDSRSKPKMKDFLGARPPSELISQELTTYFPDHQKETLEKTVRMSMRRSARLSRAASRISVASNASFTSSLRDAPPLPNIADAWLTNGHTRGGPRPLSVSRFAIPQVAYRDSIASSSLQPLQEESPSEPNRKSYVSFESDSQAGLDEGSTTLHSYFDESGSSGPTTEAGGSLTDQLTHAIADDGEGPDDELDSFLKGDSWDNVKWMKGALIGQGSFGSVYLALHAITGELMAVKQVEVPSTSISTIDKKKESMINALKREIDLLRDLQHKNIVQYLGSNSDDEHFNIFLEYVPGGSVAGMLNSYGQLQEPLIRSFVRQILDGLSYLHGKDIIHRDIKGANVLVDGKGNIKISDFGISKRVEASALLSPAKNGGHIHRPSLQGSVFWMAPEVVKQTSYTRKADIWSLGCLIVEMFTGAHPFPNCSQLQAIFQIGNSSAKPTTPEHISEEGKNFLSKTFEIDYEKRPSADELLLSPFLKQIA
ncbi:MAG: hypothetical protein LQ346_003595 [Caloplaca aetnensis]|nr:MAG: hypothetical protein LQ346_003595 [Caloplaca aetnensis]